MTDHSHTLNFDDGTQVVFVADEATKHLPPGGATRSGKTDRDLERQLFMAARENGETAP